MTWFYFFFFRQAVHEMPIFVTPTKCWDSQWGGDNKYRRRPKLNLGCWLLGSYRYFLNITIDRLWRIDALIDAKVPCETVAQTFVSAHFTPRTWLNDGTIQPIQQFIIIIIIAYRPFSVLRICWTFPPIKLLQLVLWTVTPRNFKSFVFLRL